MNIPRYTGHDADDQLRPEQDHLATCSCCSALVDLRDLAQVMAHQHSHAPFDLTGLSDEDIKRLLDA